MKTADPALVSAIRNDYQIKALPKFTVDFEMNRYHATTVDNVLPDAANNPALLYFPIASIVEANRPTKGMNKARIGESTISPGYNAPGQPRFYLASKDDQYKYWQSPTISNGSAAISNVQPYVIYDSMVTVNKIVIHFETTWATPNAWNVQITTNGTTWTTVSTAPTIANNGTVILWWNGTAWSVTKPTDITNTQSIKGVRLNVTTLAGGTKTDGTPTTYKSVASSGQSTNTINTDGKNSHFSLISLGANWEVDMTSRVMKNTDTFDYGTTSQITPLGEVTSNVADVTLWNGDGWLSNDNPSSPYVGMIDANSRCNLKYVYYVNGTTYEVQQFSMFADVWKGQKTEEVSLSLVDHSKFFQQINPRPAMYQNKTLGEIVYRILDSIGFVKYVIDTNINLSDYTIPIFWTDGEDDVWSVLGDLAEATQSAIYFDSTGTLRVRTRDAAFNRAAASTGFDWTALAVETVDGLPDIISMEQTEQYETNDITVKYTPRAFSDFNNGQPALQTIWEPDGDLAVRACELIGDLTTTADYFIIKPEDAAIWPYTSVVNIEGEFIEYDAKGYYYYTGSDGATKNSVYLTTADDLKKYNDLTPADFKFKNTFSGAMRIKVNADSTKQRGVWNTTVKPHNVFALQNAGYENRFFHYGSSTLASTAGFLYDYPESRVILTSHAYTATSSDMTMFTQNGVHYPDTTRPNIVGTRIKFLATPGATFQYAGLVVNNSGPYEDGYYIEMIPTEKIPEVDLGAYQSLRILAKKNNVYTIVLEIPAAVVEGVDYDLDVRIYNDHTLTVWLNGVVQAQATVPVGAQVTPSQKFGVYTRYYTAASFDYLYGLSGPLLNLPDDFTIYDRINGGYQADTYNRLITYQQKTTTTVVPGSFIPTNSGIPQNLNGTLFGQPLGTVTTTTMTPNYAFFDEFGPIVHEVRQFDVKFDPAPVLHSRVFNTNDAKSAVIDYTSTPFSAKFTVVNVNRDTSVLSGDDASNGTDTSVSQVFTVIGRAVVDGEEASIEVKNDAQIRVRGPIKTDLSNDWIQTKESAQTLADWIKLHWSTGLDEHELEIFGNPLIEAGDIIKVYFPAKNINNVKYFVTGVTNDFDAGLKTTLTLRACGI